MKQQELNQKIAYLEELNELLGDPIFRESNPVEFEQILQKSRAFAAEINGGFMEELLSKKQMAADDVLLKIQKYLLVDSGNSHVNISFTKYASGHVQYGMIEQIMPAILAAVKILSLQIIQKYPKSRSLFVPNISIHCEFVSDSDHLYFRLVDSLELDSSNTQFKPMKKEIEKSISAIKHCTAKYNGWCKFTNFSERGTGTEICIPAVSTRQRVSIFRYGSMQVAVPSVCVVDLIPKEQIKCIDHIYYATYKDRDLMLCQVDALQGLVEIEDSYTQEVECTSIAVVNVADQSFGLIVHEEIEQYHARMQSVEDFVRPESWYQSVACYLQHGTVLMAPYISGETVMAFVEKWGGQG
jgi:hypothetical protein